MIKIYSTPYCSICEALKSWLKENKQKFESIDVSESDVARDEMVSLSNQLSIPVTNIDGNIILGFDLKKFKETLNL